MSYEVKVRPEKVEAVEKIKGDLGDTSAVLLTSYRGLTVTELATLRSQLGDAEVSYRVVKNTLARRAMSEAGFAELEELLTGPTALAYCKGDAVTAARVLATFAKEHPALVVKGGILDGRVMTAEESQSLATVDVLDVSRAKIAGQLTAGLSQIVNLLEAPLRQVLFVLEEIAKREPAAAGAQAAEGADATDQAPDPGQQGAEEAEAPPEAQQEAEEAEAPPEAPEEPGNDRQEESEDGQG